MKLIAHRGGRGFGTDNTLQAMEAAVRAGVLAIETDVRHTLDGELIICHDAMIWNRVISRTTYAELRRYAPERPSLSELLESLAGWVSFNLEIKEASARAVGEMLETYRIEKDTMVTSFNRSFLESFKADFPLVRTGLLYRMTYSHTRKVHSALSARAEVLAPHFHSIDRELVEHAHKSGLEVYAWTVNDRQDFSRLYEWGVDGIITDRYLDMRDYLRELK